MGSNAQTEERGRAGSLITCYILKLILVQKPPAFYHPSLVEVQSQVQKKKKSYLLHKSRIVASHAGYCEDEDNKSDSICCPGNQAALINSPSTYR